MRRTEPKYRVGVVSSSRTVIETVQGISLDPSIDLQWAATTGMDAAVEFGRAMEKKGVEVVIGRRATAHFLRKALSIPVLALPVTSLDILNCIKAAIRYGRRILLPTYGGLFMDTGLIEEVFDVKIIQRIYTDGKTLEEAVRYGAEVGADVVIGGGGSTHYAEKYGIKGLEIIVSAETLSSILEDACSVAQSKREEMQRAMRYRYIVNAATDAIISIDQNGVVTTMNQAAKKLFNIRRDDIEGELLQNCIPGTRILDFLKNGRHEINELETIDGKSFLTNYMPIEMDTGIIGVVATFKDASDVIKDEKKIRKLSAKGLVTRYSIKDFVHRSQRMKDMIQKVKQFSKSFSTILIMGETGTGKEIIAQSIHNLSPRRLGPFVSINCGALPDQLLESELFGYEEGAFTGSRRGGKPGHFELAHQGTIFLDEIASTSSNVQTRLLRVLQEKEVMRIGGNEFLPVDVRVVAATNTELAEEVEKGRLREDLFFRLDVLKITVAPLRERMEDLPLLVRELLKRISAKYRIAPVKIPVACMHTLMEYRWPGNIRQLENFLERLTLLCGNGFDQAVFDELFHEVKRYVGQSGKNPEPLPAATIKLGDIYDHNEEILSIERALRKAKYNKIRAARALGISRTTLWRKIKQLNIDTA